MRIRDILAETTHVFEIIVSLFIMITAVFLFGREAIGLIFGGIWETTISEVLVECFSFIIAIEFVRVLIQHSVGSLIEVLLFAVARGMIVEHLNPKETFVTIISLAVLFFIRRFLIRSGQMDLEEAGGDVDPGADDLVGKLEKKIMGHVEKKVDEKMEEKREVDIYK